MYFIIFINQNLTTAFNYTIKQLPQLFNYTQDISQTITTEFSTSITSRIETSLVAYQESLPTFVPSYFIPIFNEYSFYFNGITSIISNPTSRSSTYIKDLLLVTSNEVGHYLGPLVQQVKGGCWNFLVLVLFIISCFIISALVRNNNIGFIIMLIIKYVSEMIVSVKVKLVLRYRSAVASANASIIFFIIAYYFTFTSRFYAQKWTSGFVSSSTFEETIPSLFDLENFDDNTSALNNIKSSSDSIFKSSSSSDSSQYAESTSDATYTTSATSTDDEEESEIIEIISLYLYDTSECTTTTTTTTEPTTSASFNVFDAVAWNNLSEQSPAPQTIVKSTATDILVNETSTSILFDVFTWKEVQSQSTQTTIVPQVKMVSFSTQTDDLVKKVEFVSSAVEKVSFGTQTNIINQESFTTQTSIVTSFVESQTIVDEVSSYTESIVPPSVDTLVEQETQDQVNSQLIPTTQSISSIVTLDTTIVPDIELPVISSASIAVAPLFTLPVVVSTLSTPGVVSASPASLALSSTTEALSSAPLSSTAANQTLPTAVAPFQFDVSVGSTFSATPSTRITRKLPSNKVERLVEVKESISLVVKSVEPVKKIVPVVAIVANFIGTQTLVVPASESQSIVTQVLGDTKFIVLPSVDSLVEPKIQEQLVIEPSTSAIQLSTSDIQSTSTSIINNLPTTSTNTSMFTEFSSTSTSTPLTTRAVRKLPSKKVETVLVKENVSEVMEEVKEVVDVVSAVVKKVEKVKKEKKVVKEDKKVVQDKKTEVVKKVNQIKKSQLPSTTSNVSPIASTSRIALESTSTLVPLPSIKSNKKSSSRKVETVVIDDFVSEVAKEMKKVREGNKPFNTIIEIEDVVEVVEKVKEVKKVVEVVVEKVKEEKKVVEVPVEKVKKVQKVLEVVEKVEVVPKVVAVVEELKELMDVSIVVPEKSKKAEVLQVEGKKAVVVVAEAIAVQEDTSMEGIEDVGRLKEVEIIPPVVESISKIKEGKKVQEDNSMEVIQDLPEVKDIEMNTSVLESSSKIKKGKRAVVVKDVEMEGVELIQAVVVVKEEKVVVEGRKGEREEREIKEELKSVLAIVEQDPKKLKKLKKIELKLRLELAKKNYENLPFDFLTGFSGLGGGLMPDEPWYPFNSVFTIPEVYTQYQDVLTPPQYEDFVVPPVYLAEEELVVVKDEEIEASLAFDSELQLQQQQHYQEQQHQQQYQQQQQQQDELNLLEQQQYEFQIYELQQLELQQQHEQQQFQLQQVEQQQLQQQHELQVQLDQQQYQQQEQLELYYYEQPQLQLQQQQQFEYQEVQAYSPTTSITSIFSVDSSNVEVAMDEDLIPYLSLTTVEMDFIEISPLETSTPTITTKSSKSKSSSSSSLKSKSIKSTSNIHKGTPYEYTKPQYIRKSRVVVLRSREMS